MAAPTRAGNVAVAAVYENAQLVGVGAFATVMVKEAATGLVALKSVDKPAAA